MPTGDGPSRDRPEMPDGYGVPDTTDGLLEWSAVEERLVASPQYWMATTRRDGRPHVVPRWGVWVDGRFWYDGAPTTVHARNIARSGACTLHLEDGWQAVIVEGTSQPADPPGVELGARLAAGFATKYATRGYEPGPDSWEGPSAGGLVVFRPTKAVAWFDFPNDVTRFRFTP
ncbi:MAG TPA: pyridoxamine 5'-phosphate oxidase family protein [Acidimicrobiales bacterium]|nr:pyridoxamine 5'-phosphate oxidase family protein [Acidimicrobiales bacterium]